MGGETVGQRLDKNGRLRWRQEEGYYTVYNYDSDDLFEVPETAITIFGLANADLDVSEVVDRVLHKHPDLGRLEVKEYVRELVEAGLLKLV